MGIDKLIEKWEDKDYIQMPDSYYGLIDIFIKDLKKLRDEEEPYTLEDAERDMKKDIWLTKYHTGEF